ncbi:MAG: endonuclease/exonuclease/phosphatase family protein [Acidimicrobiia bacterium]|nr:endonuclease/exonuclease/phosphatase family protein [Acidimicrobiia bacterium]
MAKNSLFSSVSRGLATVTLLVIAVPASLASAAGFFGRGWWLFDVLASFRPQFFVILLLAGIAYGTLVSWTGGGIFLVMAAANAFVLAPLFFGSPATAEGVERLEIITFNVQADARNRVEVMAWLEDNPADVVVLVVSSIEWEEAARRADLPYEIYAGPLPDRSFGITVLALDARNVESHDIDGDQIVQFTVDFPGHGPVTILAIHPQAPVTPAAAAANELLLVATGTMAAQVEGSVVVVGDLNTTPWSARYRDLMKRGQLESSSTGFGIQPTWPANIGVASIPIDHLLHSADLTTTDREVGPDLGSDHYPVIIRLAPAADEIDAANRP